MQGSVTRAWAKVTPEVFGCQGRLLTLVGMGEFLEFLKAHCVQVHGAERREGGVLPWRWPQLMDEPDRQAGLDST